jgi:AraC-like DNA-binding protein
VAASTRSEASRSWRLGVAGIEEVLHASFTDHAYPPHTHECWTVLVLDAGQVAYELDRHERGADRRQVTVLPPHVAHDGRSARAGRRFTKRVLYLDTATITEELVGRAVDTPSVDDLALRRAVARMHRLLDGQVDQLAATSQLALVAEAITGHLSGHPAVERTSSEAAEALRARLDEDLAASHDLGVHAAELGWSATHLIRSFRDEHGLPPHQYLIGRRVAEARRLLLDGVPSATVAAEVGFYDQAHLHRHFRRHVGTTPGRFQQRGLTSSA